MNKEQMEYNLEEVKNRIRKAALAAARKPKEVTLIAVSKTKPTADLLTAYELGVRDFGENKVQELSDKYEQLPKDSRFHMIGHLQTNKVRQVVGKACLIHSVDSLKLAAKISDESLKKNLVSDILIQVNVAMEESKFGVPAEAAAELVKEAACLPGLRIKGLMTIAPFTEISEENREIFRTIKKISVDIMKKNIDNVHMDVLSMGMSGDYQTAIEEGATCVRIGTGIFGEREYIHL